MGPVSTPLQRHHSGNRWVPLLVAALLLPLGSFSAAQTPDFDFGDGRHGSLTLPPGETTVQDVWSQVRGGSDSAAYDPGSGDQVPNLENLTISSGSTLTVSGYTGNPGGAVDPTLGGVLRLKVRGTLTIEAGGAISVTGKGYRGGSLEGAAPGRIGQQGDSWGNGGAISGDANRGGGGGGFGEVNGGDNPGAGGGGGHREAGTRGTTGAGAATGGLGGASFDTVATALGQGFRDTFPFPRFGSGGGRGGQVENFTNIAATGGNGGGVIIIEARQVVNNGGIAADGGTGGSNLSGGGGGAGGSVLIQSLAEANGTVTANGGAGGVGTVLGNDGGTGGAGTILCDTRFPVTTSVEGQGSVTLSPSGGFYDNNALVEVLAVPEAGWTFDHWEGDLTGSVNPENLTVDGEKSVTAFFVELPSLDVTPSSREIGPAGGNLSFEVTVSGSTGTIEWAAVVDTGADFLTINTGATGVNDDTITLTALPNLTELSRTGTIVVSSDDVEGEPITVTVTQGPATPVLSVTPAAITADAEGEELVIQVQNTGTGTFDWTASVLTGHAFASITSGNTGTDDGTFVVTVLENASAMQRSATISVGAPGALNSPAIITITQQAGVPLLQVTPSSQLIGSVAGTASLQVDNGGTGSMNWTAAVIEGGAFASITTGSSGTDAGLISLAFQSNTTMANRTARVRVESVDAANSPVDVTITQTAQETVLLVSPDSQTVGSSAGTASFQVQNTGTGTMNWTAAVMSGANFVSITGGLSGSNDGTIVLTVAENTSLADRTATLRITAPGAANSPQTVTLVQTSRTPVLRVVPAQQSVGSAGGAVNITVENAGTGTLNWTASLDTGAEFLSITSPASGSDNGSIQVTVAANGEGDGRTGTVRIEAPGAVDSPQIASIIQLGCQVLNLPENLAASDGIYSNAVQLIWSAVPNAVEYEVFRSPLEFPEQRELIGTTGEPRFADALAEAPDYELVNRGCFNPGEFIITYVIYNYQVRAINACGASEFSERTTGYRGLPANGEAAAVAFFAEDALPSGDAAGSAALVGSGDSIALRLFARAGIGAESLWAQINGEPAEVVSWYPAGDSDGWAVFANPGPYPEGAELTVDAGAVDLSGESVAASHTFVSSGESTEKADGTHVAVLPTLLADESAGQFLSGLGDVYAIQPSAAFPEPVLIQIPVPEQAPAGVLTLYYHGVNESGAAWYPAAEVAGWLASPVALSADGAYLEAWVNHAGTVRAGLAPGEGLPVSGALLPVDYGTAVIFLLTVLLLAGAGRSVIGRTRTVK
jgi:hypothetical protein